MKEVCRILCAPLPNSPQRRFVAIVSIRRPAGWEPREAIDRSSPFLPDPVPDIHRKWDFDERLLRTIRPGDPMMRDPLGDHPPPIGHPVRQAHYDLLKRLHAAGWKNTRRHKAPWWAITLERNVDDVGQRE